MCLVQAIHFKALVSQISCKYNHGPFSQLLDYQSCVNKIKNQGKKRPFKICKSGGTNITQDTGKQYSELPSHHQKLQQRDWFCHVSRYGKDQVHCCLEITGLQGPSPFQGLKKIQPALQHLKWKKKSVGGVFSCSLSAHPVRRVRYASFLVFLRTCLLQFSETASLYTRIHWF